MSSREGLWHASMALHSHSAASWLGLQKPSADITWLCVAARKHARPSVSSMHAQSMDFAMMLLLSICLT